jgi:L-aspartate oxidase
MVGGVTVDRDGRTTLPGLWAAGEVTSSGLHGANRLASNSLLEGLVYGARAAEDIVGTLAAGAPHGRGLEVPPIAATFDHNGQEPLDLADIRDSLRALMWRSVGITRDGVKLAEAAEQVDFWCRYVLDQVFPDPAGWTMQNMLTVARLMIAAASAREESRGVHWRRDFPQTEPAWAHHITIQEHIQCAYVDRDVSHDPSLAGS